MNFDPQEFIPKANNWFSLHVQYEGWGKAQFTDPAGTVEGPTKVIFDELGEPVIEMMVEIFITEKKLEFGLTQLMTGGKVTKTASGLLMMGIGGGIPGNTCHAFEVQADSGKFHALDNSIPYSYSSFDDSVIKLFPHKALFIAKNSIEAKYWIVPLINFISEFSQHHKALDRHPLRIFPTPAVPDGLSKNEALTAHLHANSRNRLIVFFTDGGNPGFIEALPDFNERKEKLLKGQENGLVTGIIVGRLGSSSVNFEDLRGWAPFEFLRLLSLATGSEVGAAWIEFRDGQGRLVQRFHSVLDQKWFYKGHRIIDESINIGIGNLLTQAQESPDFGRSYLRVLLKYLVRSGYENLTLEDKLAYLFRGLDGLCGEYGLTKPLNLNEILSNEVLVTLDDIITKAAKSLRAIANNTELTKDETERIILCRIADQIVKAKTVVKGFGKNVVALSKKFELPDSDIIAEWYKLNPRSDKNKRWENVLSDYRGIIMHRGFFDFDEGGQDLWDVVRITNHLHDILIRILFKTLGYDGTYQPRVLKYRTNKAVDWVKEDTPASELGY